MAFLCGLLQRRSFQTQAEGLLNFDRVRVFENLLLINFVLIGSGHSLTQEKRLRQIGSVFTIVLLLPFGEFFNCFSPGVVLRASRNRSLDSLQIVNEKLAGCLPKFRSLRSENPLGRLVVTAGTSLLVDFSLWSFFFKSINCLVFLKPEFFAFVSGRRKLGSCPLQRLNH
jgi:hypothetical protein